MASLKSRSRAVEQILKNQNFQELERIIDRLDAEATKEVRTAIATILTRDKKAQTITKLQTIIKNTDTEIKDWIVQSVSASYIDGMNLTANDLKKTRKLLRADIPSGEVTVEKLKTLAQLSVHKDAVNALISDAYLDFGNSMNGLVRGAEHQLNETLKRQVRAKNIAGQLSGAGVDKIARDIKKIMSDQGFSVLIDRGGHRWSLQNYSRMLARTHIVKSTNEGFINRALEFDVDIVQITTVPGACSICQEFEGNIYSVSGKSKEYPELTEIPPYHPNCRHGLLLRPDL